MENWSEAQEAVLERLAKVREHLDNEDGGSAVLLINQQDAFCDAARERRDAVAPSSQEPLCSFCEGSRQSDGCLERLAGINRAVLDERWDEAGALVDDYVAWVKGLAV